jgi:inorganic pyrophosphatase
MKNINVIIETPKASIEKYAFDKKSGFFQLKKILPAGMSFPFDFGFIQQTEGEDGDPLDALVISELKSFPGCMMECRLIGAITAEETGEDGIVRNDRFLLVPVLSKQFEKLEKIEDMSQEELKELGNFFVQYNKAEGKEFHIIKMQDPKKAYQQIKKGHAELVKMPG